MKHSLKITALLLGMFVLTQFIGIAVLHAYAPEVTPVIAENGTVINVTTYDLPYGTEPPSDLEPRSSLASIIIALIVAVALIFLLMKLRAEIILRLWFFAVVVLAVGITLNAALPSSAYTSWIAALIALPLAYLKVFQRNIVVHNVTELLIYPGIAAIFVPLLNLATVSILLIVISVYDIYAVWHSGFMQRLAHYQIKTLRVFSGFFVPYLSKEQRRLLRQQQSRQEQKKSMKVNVAILGGGDVVFPLIMAGVVLRQFSLWPALAISLGATLALALLFYFSEKGKFYPAMPFISAGCFAALGVAFLWL